VFAVLAAHDRAALAEIAGRPRLPGSAVALLLKPWTWSASSQSLPGEEMWHAASELLRAAGWRVVGVEAGAELSELWPQLLSSRAGVR
jgi:hypothetical protein